MSRKKSCIKVKMLRPLERFYHIVCVSHCKISRLTLLAFVISPQIAGCGAKTDKFSKSIGGAWISKRYGLGDQKINTQHWNMFFYSGLISESLRKFLNSQKNVSNLYPELFYLYGFRIEIRIVNVETKNLSN